MSAARPPAVSSHDKNADVPFGTVLWGRRFDDGSPVLTSPFRPDGSLEVTAVLGRPGSGKSYWLADHAARLVGAGVPLLAIDPLGDLRELFSALGGRNVTLGSDSPTHINPFRRSAAEPGADLRPVFAVLLGKAFSLEAEAILGQAQAAFYATPDAPEQALDGFLAALQGLPLASAMLALRDELVARLRAAGEDSRLIPLLTQLTDVGLDLEPDVPLRIDFGQALFDDEEGSGRALSVLAAFGLARAMGLASVTPKVLLINDLDLLLRSRLHAAPLAEAFTEILRSHRQANMALTFGLDLQPEEKAADLVLRGLVAQASSFVLLRASAPALHIAAQLAGTDVELLTSVLTPDPGARGSRHESRPAVLVHGGVAKAIRIVGT